MSLGQPAYNEPRDLSSSTQQEQGSKIPLAPKVLCQWQQSLQGAWLTRKPRESPRGISVSPRWDNDQLSCSSVGRWPQREDQEDPRLFSMSRRCWGAVVGHPEGLTESSEVPASLREREA